MATIPASEFYSQVINQPFDKKSFTKDLETNKRFNLPKDGYDTVKILTIDTANSVKKHFKDNTIAQHLNDIPNAQATYNTYKVDQAFKIGQFLDRQVLAQNATNDLVASVLDACVAEQLIPKIDAYRIGVLTASATTSTQVINAGSDAYADILKGATMLKNARQWAEGRMKLYLSSTHANALRLSNHFTAYTESQYKNLANGTIGRVAGFDVIEAPADIFVDKHPAVGVNTSLVVSIRQLDLTKITEPSFSFGKLALALYVYTTIVPKANEKCVFAIKTL